MVKTSLLVLVAPALALLWPQPMSMTNGSTLVTLSPNVQMVFVPAPNATNLTYPSAPLNMTANLTSISSLGCTVGSLVCDSTNNQVYSICGVDGAPVSMGSTPAGFVCVTTALGAQFQLANRTMAAGNGTPYTGPYNANQKVMRAMQRAKDMLFGERYIPWNLHPFGRDFEPSTSALGNASIIQTIQVSQTSQDPARAPKAGQVDESYSLVMGGNSSLTITCATSFGCLNALQTLTQLFYQHSQGPVYSTLAPVSISDSPRFGHRGLLLDVSRGWYNKPSILKLIDSLSYSKFNRLHLHATDSQSWPVYISSMPELAEKGSYAPGLYYTPTDLDEMLRYAEDRGIQLYLEIDLPGHCNSIAYSHPELIVGSDNPNWELYANQPPAGQMKLNDTRVTPFLQSLMGDLLPRVAPYSSVFSTGGDEFNQNIYTLEANVGTNDSSVIQPLDEAIVLGLHKQVYANNLTPIVWEEQLLTWNVSLANDTIVQSWLSTESVQEITSRGYQCIAGAYQLTYLDCGYGDWTVPATLAEYNSSYPFTDYCIPYKNWQLLYSYDPVANLTAEQAELVIGAEVHLWSEQASPANMDEKLWPRAAAAAEVFWSGRTYANGTNRTNADAAPRIYEFGFRLAARGISSDSITQLWCAQGRNEQCYSY